MTILLRTNLPDLNLSTMLPAIKKVIQEDYNDFDSVVDKVLNVGQMNSSIVQHTQVSSLLPAPQVGEAEEFVQDRPVAGFDTTFTALKYGLLLPISQESMDDDMFNVMNQNPKRLARSFAAAREISAMSIFNNAFSTTLQDGVSLCSTAHPLLVQAQANGANRPAADADLDITALKAGMTLFRAQVDSAGNKLRLRPKYLLVSPSDEFNATELVKSVMLPGGSTNNVNSINSLYNLEVVVSDYLTDNDAWFIIGEEHNAWFMWRKQPAITDFLEEKTEVHMVKISGRWAVGASDWRGIHGTAGA